MEATVLMVFVLAAVGASWLLRRAKTFPDRSTAVLLRAWPEFDQVHGGRRFLGAESTIVFYRNRYNWLDQRAEFELLARTTQGQWFEARVKVFAVRKVCPTAVVPLTPHQAQEWLHRYRAHDELNRYFGAIEIA